MFGLKFWRHTFLVFTHMEMDKKSIKKRMERRGKSVEDLGAAGDQLGALEPEVRAAYDALYRPLAVDRNQIKVSRATRGKC